ncbi:hypothetical protein [Jeotgalibaca arthritidis]|uniref:Uncharacterized protein n=1 Tax=Jeotgalibaca arthritidis TaxID=1868794 RepID=A0A6G7KCE0_9LACT|nr:hypothetical protein [Jeotgalibaca arthritidis]QII82907.1 hypothetical protein G7057_10935 [Jeotgalibaca arthritidis]
MKKRIDYILNKLDLSTAFKWNMGLLIVGIILRLNFFPASGIDLPEEQAKEIWAAGSINYPLGNVLVCCSFLVFVLIFVAYVYKKYKNKEKRL